MENDLVLFEIIKKRALILKFFFEMVKIFIVGNIDRDNIMSFSSVFRDYNDVESEPPNVRDGSKHTDDFVFTLKLY